MKKILLISLVFLISCGISENKKNERNKQVALQMENFAGKSEGTISELPLNFRFKMSEAEVKVNLNNLIEQGIISNPYVDAYVYTLKLSNSTTIDFFLEFDYHQDELYFMTFSSPKISEIEIKALETYIDISIDSMYTKTTYYNIYEREKEGPYIQWIKENQIIYINNIISQNTVLGYKNEPITRIVRDASANEYLDEARVKTEKGENNVVIENSELDASVSQVKTYLKKNLNDSKSYESIEWSPVTKTEYGYMVRHKYRAKNQLGLLIIENKIFKLNKSGQVISSSDF